VRAGVDRGDQRGPAIPMRAKDGKCVIMACRQQAGNCGVIKRMGYY